MSHDADPECLTLQDSESHLLTSSLIFCHQFMSQSTRDDRRMAPLVGRKKKPADDSAESLVRLSFDATVLLSNVSLYVQRKSVCLLKMIITNRRSTPQKWAEAS